MLQTEVLSCLEENKGKAVTGGQIARKLGVSRTAVWKAIRALRDKGHEIESFAGSGYRLNESSDGLSERSITELLATRKFGRKIELHETIHSTNTYIKELNASDYPEGFTVIAEEQTSGRGRFDRKFYSPARQGIYLSVLLKPDIDILEVSTLTICAAVAVCRAVEKVTGVAANIKWVNDIYTGGKKLCGILSEASVSAELQKVDYVVVGIGINTGTVDAAVRDVAASVLDASGRQGLRNRLIAEVLNQLEEVYLDFVRRHKKESIIAAYSERLMYIRKRVEVKEASGNYEATVLGVDETGALLVRLPDGKTRRITSGEIVALKEKEEAL